MIYLPHELRSRDPFGLHRNERNFDLLNLGNLKGLGLPGGDRGIWRPYTTNLEVTDGDAAYDTMAEVLAIIGALAAGSVWTKIWEKTVPAQQRMRWGYGNANQPHNQGYLWFCSLDTNVDFQVGKLRLVQCKARDRGQIIVQEYDDRQLHLPTVTTLTTATPTDRATMKALPEQVQFSMVGEDSLLQLWYRCIAAATAEDNVGFSIPVTIYERI